MARKLVLPTPRDEDYPHPAMAQDQREFRRALERQLNQISQATDNGATDGLYAAEGFLFNAGNVLIAGDSDWLAIPSDFTIVSAEIVGDPSGSISVAVYASTYTNWSTFSLVSASAPITLTSATKNRTALAGWTTTFTGGTYLRFTVTGTPVSITKATITLVLAVPAGATGTGSSPSGAAGGDLSGTYPNPTIVASVALGGNPTTTTQSAANNSTRIATTAYVDTGLALKANLASPTFTGTPAAPTATVGTNTTQVATTAFVLANAVAAATTADTVPASPNAADDEWEGVALDTAGTRRAGATAWAWQNQGTATLTFGRGSVILTAVASGGAGTMVARYILQTAPAGDWAYEAKMRLLGAGAAVAVFTFGGLAIRESATGKALIIGQGSDNSATRKAQVRRLTGDTTWTANVYDSTTDETLVDRTVYFKVTRVGTTITCYNSFDGIDYLSIYSAVQTVDFTTQPTQVGLVASSPNAPAMRLTCEWFRRTA